MGAVPSSSVLVPFRLYPGASGVRCGYGSRFLLKMPTKESNDTQKMSPGKTMHSTHVARGDQRLRSCAPPSSEIAQGMTSAECNTAEEGPLLALDPVVILDVVRICPERIHQQERNGINVGPDRPGDVQRRPGYFGGPDGHQPK